MDSEVRVESMEGAEAVISVRILSSKSSPWSWIAEPFIKAGVVTEDVGSGEGVE